jgi:hypothetical protein
MPEVADKPKLTDQTVAGDTSQAAAERIAATSRKWGTAARQINLQLD